MTVSAATSAECSRMRAMLPPDISRAPPLRTRSVSTTSPRTARSEYIVEIPNLGKFRRGGDGTRDYGSLAVANPEDGRNDADCRPQLVALVKYRRTHCPDTFIDLAAADNKTVSGDLLPLPHQLFSSGGVKTRIGLHQPLDLLCWKPGKHCLC